MTVASQATISGSNPGSRIIITNLIFFIVLQQLHNRVEPLNRIFSLLTHQFPIRIREKLSIPPPGNQVGG